MEYKDYYSILGVDKKASPEDIKKAYRRLARKYHPDVSKEKNAEEQFKNVQEAYEVLKDPQKRSSYDQLGSQWKAGQEFHAPPGWDSYTRYYGDNDQFAEGDFSGFSDFFANLFGGRRGGHEQFNGGGRHTFSHRGADQHAKITVTLDDAYQGTTKTLQMQMPDGQIRTIKVTIPPGTLPGQQLRLTGQGGPGMGGAKAGDLYLEVDINPHRLFTLSDRDIYLNLPLTPWEAALGAQIRVPTLGGPVGLKIPPGTQSGQKLRLKGRGMPGKPAAGDEYAIVQIMVPTPKTEVEKELYNTMATTMPFNPRQDWGV